METTTLEMPISVETAAKYLNLSKNSVYQLTCKKRIPYFKVNGGSIFFKKQDLDNFIAKGRIAADFEIEQQAEKLLIGGCK